MFLGKAQRVLRGMYTMMYTLETIVAQGRLDDGCHGEVADVFGVLGWVGFHGDGFAGSLGEGGYPPTGWRQTLILMLIPIDSDSASCRREVPRNGSMESMH